MRALQESSHEWESDAEPLGVIMPFSSHDLYPLKDVLLYRLAALPMSNREVCVRLRAVLKPEYFAEDPLSPLRVTVAVMLEHIEQWNTPPSWEVLEHAVMDRVAHKATARRPEDRAAQQAAYRQVLRRLCEADVTTDRLWLERQAVEHAKNVAMGRCILGAAADLEGANGNSPEVRRKIRRDFADAMAVGNEASELGLRYSDAVLEVVDEVTSGRKDLGRIMTGWRQLDDTLRGIGNELVVIAGETGSFKTGTCVNLGANVAAQGKFVAHASFEGEDDIITFRYARCIARVTRAQAAVMSLRELNHLLHKFTPLGGEVQVKYFSRRKHGVDDVESWLAALASSYRRPDLVVVDYADKMQPPARRYERNDLALAAIYDELYALSREFSTGPGDRHGIPIVTPSQVGKGAFGKAVVTADMLAGALAKAMIADIILPICQTWEERRMQPWPVMRLFRAKVRESEGLGMVWFDQDKDRMLLTERAPIALKADGEE